MAGRTCTVVLIPGASTSMALGQYCRASRNLVVVAPGHVGRVYSGKPHTVLLNEALLWQKRPGMHSRPFIRKGPLAVCNG